MVNSDIPAGTYFIRPKDAPQDLYLTIGPHTPTEPPPDIPVVLGDRFLWVLKDTNTNTSIVHVQGGHYKWITKDNSQDNFRDDRGSLFVSVAIEAAVLNFERISGSDFVIDNPGFASSRLTYHKDALPPQPIFTFQDAINDSSAQLFEVNQIFIDPKLPGNTAH